MPKRTLVALWLCLCVVPGLAACRKKSAPQFYTLESTWSIMVARDGDDAYLDPAMDQVVTGLQAIDPEAVEAARATALLATIAAERARLAAEKAEAEKAQQEAERARPELPSLLSPLPEDAGTPAAAAVDAGPPRPYLGMSRDEFQRLFGACVEPAGEFDVPGLGMMIGFAAQDRYACRQQLGVADDTRHVFLFKSGQLKVERTERIPPPVDAGPPRVVDAGAPINYLPGMPLPEGYK